MGFSYVGAFAILGVSLLIGLEVFMGSMLPAVSTVNDSFSEMKNRAVDKTQSDITIDSVSTVSNGSNYDINVSLNNTGSVTFDIDDCNLLINGSITSFSCSNRYLYPTNTVYLLVYNLAGEGVRKIKVIADTGVSDYARYNI